jgi:hypothetical protein
LTSTDFERFVSAVVLANIPKKTGVSYALSICPMMCSQHR